MTTPAREAGGTERRMAAGLRQALLLSSAGHLLALAACLLLGSGVPMMSVPAVVDVVLVTAAGPGGAESAGPGRRGALGSPAPSGPGPKPLRIGPDRNARRLPAPEQSDRRKVGSPPRRGERLANPRESVPPRRSVAPARPEEFPFRTGSAWEEGFAARALPPEAGPPPVEERPAGAAPAGAADVPAEAARDAGPAAPADAGGSRGTAFAGSRGKDGERAGTAASGAASAAAANLRDGQGGGGAGVGGSGTAAARLRDAIQSRIVYPEEAVRRGLEGEVLLRIRIGKGGSPGEIRVAKSSGARILDEAARRGVVRAAPLPSAPGWVDVPVRFSLQRPGGGGP